MHPAPDLSMLDLKPHQGEVAPSSEPTYRAARDADGAQPARLLRGRWGRPLAVAGEAAVGALFPAVLLASCRRIAINPVDRLGQVSGLAGVGLRYALLALVVVAAVLVSLRWRGGALFPVTGRLACSAIAGLTSAFPAAGVLLALRGTGLPLGGLVGDAGRITRWVEGVQAGHGAPSTYPPLLVHVLAWWSDLTGVAAGSSLRAEQIVGTALLGPVVYLAWRPLLSPPWALTIGVVSSLVLVDPYKNFVPLVLAVLVPVLLTILRTLRRAGSLSWAALCLHAAIAGAGLGLLFLSYSGWFVWSAAGVVMAGLVVFPWRCPRRGATFVALTTVLFVAVSWPHLTGLLGVSGTAKDTYFYFDTYTEPAYIAMWRGDFPGQPGEWPPPGELGGVGVFTLILVAGLGLALWLAAKRTVVISLSLLMAGAWMMRFYVAERMEGTQSVQMYPRTTQELLYLALLLAGFAAYFGVGRLARRHGPLASGSRRSWPGLVPHETGRAGSWSALLATAAAVAILGLFAGSATADQYMPSNDRSLGQLAWISHNTEQADGSCSPFSQGDCHPSPDQAVQQPSPQP